MERFLKAHIQSKETDFPKRRQKKNTHCREKTILIIQDAVRTAIRKRWIKGLLAGMYEFPSAEGHLSREGSPGFFKKKRGCIRLRISRLPDSRYVFSHKEWKMIGYCIRVDELEPVGGVKEGLLFVEPARTEGDIQFLPPMRLIRIICRSV